MGGAVFRRKPDSSIRQVAALGTGAIDDAAGVAVAMEVANLCKRLNLKPKRTIRVIAWMNEENGGRGGATYFQNHSAKLADHIAAIESDRGAGHLVGFFAHVMSETLPMLRPIADVLEGAPKSLTEESGCKVSCSEAPVINPGIG